VKKHVQEIFEKLGVETRSAAAVRAMEALNTGASSAT
jgi:DNA-binding NarL/FixJ family response regulator